MAQVIIPLEDVAKQLAWKDIPLSIQAVRYRVEKARRVGYKIFYAKVKSSKGRWVDGLTQREADTLCRLWKNLHV